MKAGSTGKWLGKAEAQLGTKLQREEHRGKMVRAPEAARAHKQCWGEKGQMWARG